MWYNRSPPSPSDLRAQAISLSEVINADTQPLQNLGTLQRVAKIAGEEAKQEWAIWAITHGLKGKARTCMEEKFNEKMA